MKTLLFSIAATLSLSISYAQDYIPMLDEGNIWSVDVYYYPFDPGCTLCNCCSYTITEQLYVSGEIVIDGKTYKQVFNNNGETECKVREENGVVYELVGTSTTETIKFDFTLDVGDSFDFTQTFYCAYNETQNAGVEILDVINVETLFIAGADRKVITFEEDFTGIGQEIWIEGIGSIRGFDSIGVVIDITNGTSLVCFTSEGKSYYFNDATACDNTTLGITDFHSKTAILYPNPVRHTSLLQFASEGIADYVAIYDINGRKVKDLLVDSNYVRIDAMDYRSGIYFCRIYSEEKLVETKKFIIH